MKDPKIGRRGKRGAGRGGAIRLLLGISAGWLLLPAAGCDTVPFYDKRRLADPIMRLDADPTEMHFFEKVRYSREGSAGGIGTSAGGGCGCF